MSIIPSINKSLHENAITSTNKLVTVFTIQKTSELFCVSEKCWRILEAIIKNIMQENLKIIVKKNMVPKKISEPDINLNELPLSGHTKKAIHQLAMCYNNENESFDISKLKINTYEQAISLLKLSKYFPKSNDPTQTNLKQKCITRLLLNTTPAKLTILKNHYLTAPKLPNSNKLATPSFYLYEILEQEATERIKSVNQQDDISLKKENTSNILTYQELIKQKKTP